MADAGVLAYPVVLMAMYGVARIGRREWWHSYEWLRLGALAILFGLIVSVQVKMIMLGLASEPIPLIGSVVSLFGMTLLLGMYLWERWLGYPRHARAVPAADAPADG